MKPQVSIIIINYNTFQFTCDCIRSIIEKTHGVTYEIIVVDNASPGDNPDEFKKLFPEIILVKSAKNLGFAKGNNLGIQHANADTYLLLNSDTTLINDAISIAYSKLMSDTHTGVVGCRLEYPDGSFQHSAQKNPTIKYQLIQLFRLQKLMSPAKRGKYMLSGYFDCETEVYADWIWGTFFMIKKAVVQLLPGHKLPDHFFMYGEDFQWGLEVKKTGYKIFYTPAARIIHLVGKSGTDYSSVAPNFYKVMQMYYGGLYCKIYSMVTAILKKTTN